MKPSRDPSIENEPHLQLPRKDADIDKLIDSPIGFDPPSPVFSAQSDEHIDYSVWNEPAVGDLVQKPKSNELTYANWLQAKSATWSDSKAWSATILIALLSGPWALVALFSGFFGGAAGQSITYRAANFLAVCAFFPLAQEIAKIALPIWVVEKRPYVFRSGFQIFVCSLASATVFVTLYNFLSLLFFPPQSPFGWVILWAGFTSVHLICSTFSAIGLIQIWQSTMSNKHLPNLDRGYRWFMTAFLVHVFAATCVFLYEILVGPL